MSVENRFMENNSDFTHTCEEENFIKGEKVFNDIKNIYWFITFIVFGIYYFVLIMILALLIVMVVLVLILILELLMILI